MPFEDQRRRVVGFYDTHPINEEQILGALADRGIGLDTLTEDALCASDQDHFGGIAANQALVRAAGVVAGDNVLDVCSGLGGPARWLAHTIGCRVTGLDFTESRHRAAIRLTQLVKLDHLVEFRHGTALDMPFGHGTFDIAISQEAFVHVPDKPRLIAECARVVRPGGTIAFTDVLRRGPLGDDELGRLAEGMAYASIESSDGYVRLLENAGCEVIVCDDLSDHWTNVLVDRLAMYRSLAPATIAKFGEARGRSWDEVYSFFVGLYVTKQLGGGRFVARKR